MVLRLTTWNVNGIRNPFGYAPWNQNRTFQAMFDTLEADVVVMQETKIQRKDLRDDMVLVPGWDVYFSLPKHKKGYSGVAIYTRNSKCCPIRAEEGITGALCPPNSAIKFRDLPQDQQIGGYPRPGQLDGINNNNNNNNNNNIDDTTLDSEGRCVVLEFPAFVLVGVYSPATRDDDTRIQFRSAFHNAMDVRIRNLVAMGKQVILMGDLNIVRDGLLDTAGLQEQLKKEKNKNMTIDDYASMPSRRFLNELLFNNNNNNGGQGDSGQRDFPRCRREPVMWDLCREFHPTRQGMYTCWETKKNARPGNFGSRIDYVCVTDGLKDWFVDSNIQEGLLGSDHCPVYGTFKTVVKDEIRIEDVVNPPGMFDKGVRLRPWTVKDLLPLSAKLIPEFDRRQSIKDMFSSASTTSTEKKKKPTTGITSRGDHAPQKRPADPASTSTSTSTLGPQQKKSKTTTLARDPTSSSSSSSSKAAAPAATSASLAQKSLTGFFKPKPATHEPRESTNGITPRPTAASDQASSVDASDMATATPAPEQQQEKDLDVYDPIENKASWQKLLKPRVPPDCEHGEPCKSMLTKKPGVNCGRSFYMCQRPLGQSGDKEKGTAFRCSTFIWSSDWSKS